MSNYRRATKHNNEQLITDVCVWGGALENIRSKQTLHGYMGSVLPVLRKTPFLENLIIDYVNSCHILGKRFNFFPKKVDFVISQTKV